MNYSQFKAATLRWDMSSGSSFSISSNPAKHDGTKALAEQLSKMLQGEGREEKDFDIEKALEAKAALLETKANEIMHTSNTGYGAELVPGAILMTDFLDLAPKNSALLSFFSVGNHGKNMPLIADVPVLGEAPLHQLMAEQTTGALGFSQGLGRLPTAKVRIQQKERFFSIDISEYELRFSVIDILATIKKKLADSAANTMVSDIINGDTATGANTNINSIDGTPAGTESYLGADGLRKTAFGASHAYDFGTLTFDDYITLLNALGQNAVNEDMIYIHSLTARNAALNIAEFKQAYVNGVNSSAMTGVLPNFLGATVVADRWLPTANTAGKVATGTPANNTKGSILAVHKAAVQYGTNGEYQIEVYRVPAKGIQVIGYYFWGHAIADSLAGGAPTVALGYNIS